MERDHPAIPSRQDDMRREYHKWYSPNLSRDMELLVFGHAGDPVIFFPTRTARFYDYEDGRALAPLQKKMEPGPTHVYCRESPKKKTFPPRHIHPAERIF